MKINFDAAFHEQQNDGAFGYVVRTNTGDTIAAGAGKLKHVKSALHAEALACIAAIEGPSDIGIHRVLLESDSQQLVYALKRGDADLSDIGVLFREARSLCVLAFESYDFMHCKRSCNVVAHALAKYGFGSAESSLVWGELMPSFVLDLVASDVAEPSG